MADWQRHIYLNPEWEQAREREIEPQRLAAAIAERINALLPFSDPYIEHKRLELAEDFESAATDSELDFDDVDYLMVELYDWGDIEIDGKWNGKKVCWIDTISQGAALARARGEKT
jgi:hypothetical protein